MRAFGARSYPRSRQLEPEGALMDTYVILRRDGWRSAADLEAAAARSTAEGERMSDDIRWIRSYVLSEPANGGRRSAGGRYRPSGGHGARAARSGAGRRLNPGQGGTTCPETSFGSS